MKLLVIPVLLIFVHGCSSKDADVVLVERFWEAANSNDIEIIKTLISNPENASMFGKRNGVLINNNIEVGEKLENGNVEISFKRFCYPEASGETKLVEVDGRMKVDVRATLMAQFKTIKDAEPLRKYCYSFKDQAMSGKISGTDITFKHFNKGVVDFGTHKKEKYELSTAPCPNLSCFKLKTPRILVSNLNFGDAGGNFNNEENITIYIPPHNNEIITEGSYRVSKTATGSNKLELSFKRDENNYINGYIEY